MSGQNSYKNTNMIKFVDNYNLHFMTEAINMAKLAYDNDEVPVGAIVVNNGKIIGRGFNQVIAKKSVSSHAEINAINQASQFIQNFRLIECDIYVTLQPCHMCAKAIVDATINSFAPKYNELIVDARINSLYFGANEPKTGAVKSIDKFLSREDLNHKVNVSGGYMQEESSTLMRKFFQSKRKKENFL